jgi:lysophospholipase L1-like esterase
VPADHAGLRWEGRLRFDKEHAAVFDWASVRFHANIEASAMALYARTGQNYLDVLVDGERVAVLGPKSTAPDRAWAEIGHAPAGSGGAPVYSLHLPPGRHHLIVSKRTAPNSGPVTILGFRLDKAGTLAAPPPAFKRRIEFIGDSLTNGYGDEGPGLKCESLPPYENSSGSWARVAAAQCKAEAQILAYSGYGLMRNYGAKTERSDDPVPFYYPRTVLAEPDVWPRERYVPDLAVVFLGTNDHSTPPIPKSAAFEDAYAAFLDQVRDGRGALKILIAYPDDNGPLCQRAKAVVESQQQIGRWVEGLALPPAAQSDLGCDWHPKLSVHARWGAVATAKIKKMMDW